MITQEWSITLACILNTYHVETGVSQVQGQPKTHSDFKVRLSYMPRPYFKNSRTEFGSGVKHVQSTHRTWLDPQNCGKMFKNIARCICSLKYDLLPSVLGDLTLSYLSNWEGYPSDKGSSFYQSTNGSTDHEKKGSFFFFFPETQIKLLWKSREVWPSLMRRSGPLPPFQALTFHLIKPRFRDFCPSSQEGLRPKVERTSSTSTF